MVGVEFVLCVGVGLGLVLGLRVEGGSGSGSARGFGWGRRWEESTGMGKPSGTLKEPFRKKKVMKEFVCSSMLRFLANESLLISRC